MTSYSNYSRTLRVAIAVAVGCVLVSCGGDNKKKAGQSIARVDDYEITVHQLNGELKNLGPQAAGGDASKLQSQALESIIDRQLLVAEAQRSKVDRDPEVMQAIEAAKSQIIAQALMRRKLAAVAKPTQDEVASYYQQNPALFANRKLFDLKQVTLASADYSDAVKRFVDNAKSVDEVVTWLDTQKIRYAKGSASRTTADLPPQVVAKLDALEKGRPFVVKDAERFTISSLVYVRDMPVSASDAAPQIEQFLMNQKARDVVTAELSRLRSSAKIEYLAGAPVPKTDSSIVPVSENKKTEDHIAKGVSGLK